MHGACKTCSFRAGDDEELLECRRFPPQPSEASHDPGMFPCVKPEWTCGEYQPELTRAD